MSNTAIRVRDLGKMYLIDGGASVPSDAPEGGAVDRWKGLVQRLRVPRQRREFWALRDVSFDVPQGEVLGLIGHNGAGKSTLLKILARIVEPSTGTAEIRGRIGSLLEVGTGFHPDLSGRENITLAGTLLGMKRSEVRSKFDEIVEFSGVGAFLDVPIKRYSSGMYMRLAFAVAAHLETEVVLVDEVLAVGDAEFQKKCIAKIVDVTTQGRTVVFVSHNLPAVQRLCSTCLLFQHGTLAAVGPAEEVIRGYLRDVTTSDTDVLEWHREAPLDAAAYFERVFVANAEGQPVASVGTGDSLRIGMEFVIRTETPQLHVTFGLIDVNSSEQIFGSAPQDTGVAPPTTPGRYRAFAELPAEVFMAREYMIRTSLWTPEGGSIDNFAAITFSAVPTASLFNSSSRLGLIALRCPWTISPR